MFLTTDPQTSTLKKFLTSMEVDYNITTNEVISSINKIVGNTCNIHYLAVLLKNGFRITSDCVISCLTSDATIEDRLKFCNYYLSKLLPLDDRIFSFTHKLNLLKIETDAISIKIDLPNLQIIKNKGSRGEQKVYHVKYNDQEYIMKMMDYHEYEMYRLLDKKIYFPRYAQHIHNNNIPERGFNEVIVLAFLSKYKNTLCSLDLLPLNKRIDIAKKMILAINEMHAKGIYHGDLKPTNICVHKGEVILIDLETANFVKDNDYEPKNSYPFMTPNSYRLRGGEKIPENGIKNDIYVTALLILFLWRHDDMRDFYKMIHGKFDIPVSHESYYDRYFRLMETEVWTYWTKFVKVEEMSEELQIELKSCLNFTGTLEKLYNELK